MKTPFKIRDDIRAYAKLSQRPGSLVAGQVELTSKCFQKCAMCESWRDDRAGVQTGVWTLGQARDLCLALSDYPTFEHLALTGGDPQNWPHLDEFLAWFLSLKLQGKIQFKLQVNTALTQDQTETQRNLWRGAVDDVRVSLDAATERTYTLMRGDKRNPVEIVNRMVALAHPRMATNTCVTTRNVDEVEAILELLEENFESEAKADSLAAFGDGRPATLRKAMFLAVIGDRDAAKTAEEKAFWHKYSMLRCLPKHFPSIPTSFSEDVSEVRAFLKSEEAASLKCYAGNSTFHVKCNGDWYPCCLTGGEAIATHPEFRMGNYFTDPLWKILTNHKTEAHYGCEGKPCAAICQYKQLSLNLAAHEAASVTLAMP